TFHFSGPAMGERGTRQCSQSPASSFTSALPSTGLLPCNCIHPFMLSTLAPTHPHIHSFIEKFVLSFWLPPHKSSAELYLSELYLSAAHNYHTRHAWPSDAVRKFVASSTHRATPSCQSMCRHVCSLPGQEIPSTH